ncbi:NUDIX hydrolase, partial [candidate division WWE3 bacterium]|nr:NUDIX hydrolase [candidate division WWE3 bacterium]
KMLLIKRSQGHTEEGKWEFPGGKVDIGQDVSNALEREVLEETGLYVKTLSPYYFYESFVLNTGRYKGLPYVVLVGKSVLLGGRVSLSEEHADFVWVTKKKALTMDLTEVTRKVLLSRLE